MVHRPKFICEPECNWPKLQLIDANTDTLQLNDQTGQMDEIATNPMLAFQASTEKTQQSFIDYSRFSKWTTVLRKTACVPPGFLKIKDYSPATKARPPN